MMVPVLVSALLSFYIDSDTWWFCALELFSSVGHWIPELGDQVAIHLGAGRCNCSEAPQYLSCDLKIQNVIM